MSRRVRTPSSREANDGRRSRRILKQVGIGVDPRAVLRTLRDRGRAQHGFTLIEVLASALVVTLLAGAAFTAFAGTAKTSYDNRVHSDAQSIAQQSEDQLRGLNINQLSNLNQTITWPTKVDSVQFYVKQTASYVTDATGTATCTNPSADYLQTTSTVTWDNMGNTPPVTETSVLTPTVGSISSGNGALAVSVTNAAGGGDAGMNVAISGPSTASGLTNAAGCVLFGDIPAGTYTVAVGPSLGTYVDAKTGASVTPATADTASIPVSAGTTPTSTSFQIDQGGSINVSFQYPNGAAIAPPAGLTPMATGVVAFNTNMNLPQYRVCTLTDTTCPVVGSPDPSFPAADWGTPSQGQITATPLFPFTSPYSVYAGTCSAEDPSKVSGGPSSDTSVTVVGGQPVNATVLVPPMVVRLWSGSSSTSPGSEEPLPASPSEIVITDPCGVKYYGYYGTNPPSVGTGQGAMPLNSNYPAGSNVTGILSYPGLPYGNYTVCYDNGSKHTQATVTNTGVGESVSLYAKSSTLPTSGKC